MPCPLLHPRDEVRHPPVEGSALVRLRAGQDHFREERMGEADTVAVQLDHTCPCRRAEALGGPPG